MVTIQETLHSVGEQSRQLRIAAGLSQAELAAKANIGAATVQRMESGHDVSLGTLIAIVRVLDRADWFDTLDPIGQEPSPMELLREEQGTPARPQRVSRPRAQRAGTRQEVEP